VPVPRVTGSDRGSPRTVVVRLSLRRARDGVALPAQRGAALPSEPGRDGVDSRHG